MTWTNILATVSALISIPIALSALLNAHVGSRKSRQDEYRFAKEFLADITNNPNCHPLLWERGFYTLSGIPDMPTTLIQTLLNARGPAWAAIRQYRSASGHYLEFDSTTGTFRWKAWCSSPQVRGLINIACTVWYVVGISAGVFVFQWLGIQPSITWPQLIFMAIANVILLFGSAIRLLLTVVRLDEAEKLLRRINHEPTPHWLIVRAMRWLRTRIARTVVATY